MRAAKIVDAGQDADRLHERGIHYMPDYVVNAGGIISVVREYEGATNEAAVDAEIVRIADRVGDLILQARATGKTPAMVAYELARQKIGFPVA